MEKRTEFLPLAKATIEIEELNAVEEVLKSGWLTTGPWVEKFELAVAEYVDIKKLTGVEISPIARPVVEKFLKYA